MSCPAMYSSWRAAIRSYSRWRIVWPELTSGSSETTYVLPALRETARVWTFTLPNSVTRAFGISSVNARSSSGEGLSKTRLACTAVLSGRAGDRFYRSGQVPIRTKRPDLRSLRLHLEVQADVGSILNDAVTLVLGPRPQVLQLVDVSDGLGGFPQRLSGGISPRLLGHAFQLDRVHRRHVASFRLARRGLWWKPVREETDGAHRGRAGPGHPEGAVRRGSGRGSGHGRRCRRIRARPAPGSSHLRHAGGGRALRAGGDVPSRPGIQGGNRQRLGRRRYGRQPPLRIELDRPASEGRERVGDGALRGHAPGRRRVRSGPDRWGYQPVRSNGAVGDGVRRGALGPGGDPWGGQPRRCARRHRRDRRIGGRAPARPVPGHGAEGSVVDGMGSGSPVPPRAARGSSGRRPGPGPIRGHGHAGHIRWAVARSGPALRGERGGGPGARARPPDRPWGGRPGRGDRHRSAGPGAPRGRGLRAPGGDPAPGGGPCPARDAAVRDPTDRHRRYHRRATRRRGARRGGVSSGGEGLGPLCQLSDPYRGR